MKTVKLFFVGLAATVAAASCQKENSSVSAPETEMVTVSFVANADDGAKASIDGLKMQWSAGDVIGVAEATKGSTIYPFVTEQGGASAVFTGQLPAGFKAGKAIYPFIDGVTVNSSAPNFQVSTPSNNQVAVLNNIPAGQNNMWAKFDDITAGSITFYHACAFMKVNVKGSDIASIKLETKSTDARDKKLKGALTLPSGKKANVSTSTGVSSSDNGVKNATLKSSDGSALAPGSYYITILATATDEFERVLTDLTITYTKSDGSKYTRSTAKSTTIVPGAVYALPGTEEDCQKLPDGPLEIKDAADMQSFVANIASYKATDVVTIENDIDLAGVTALASDGTFLGTLDGKNHSLKNWNCDKYLIKLIGLGAAVKNVVIDKTCTVTVLPTDHMGIFANENRGTLSGCVNNADITFAPTEKSSTQHHGVFLGINRNILENCTNYGNVTITANEAVAQIRYGGIVGTNSADYSKTAEGVDAHVRGCVNNGNITFVQASGTNAKDKYIAGIVAASDTDDLSSIEDCVNNGKISADGASGETKLFPGGLCGLLKGGIIKNCKNFGEVSSNSTAATVGGLISCIKLGKPTSKIITSLEGCAVNCKVTGPAATSGMVLGGMTTATDKFVFGTSDAPVKVSGTINETTVSAANLDACRVGSSVTVDGTNHVLHAVYEVVAKQ